MIMHALHRRLVRCAVLFCVQICFAAIAFAVVPDVARADFRLCNNTPSRVGIAVGYKDGDGWATEGWWNVAAHGCEVLLRGELAARFYYIYAVDYDRGGEWSGQAFMCTRDKEFTIRGTDNCLARGYDRTGFFEVDTGEQRSWTVQLTDSDEQASQRPNAPLIPSPPVGNRQAPAAVAPFPPGASSR
ncbi:MAG: DUF1036 domain-containing protein [Bradyrhizobiaceae bacterium]|nr:DUF1036 domain-containing protein [Bradyrhizobiaceae bacterium]